MSDAKRGKGFSGGFESLKGFQTVKKGEEMRPGPSPEGFKETTVGKDPASIETQPVETPKEEKNQPLRPDDEKLFQDLLSAYGFQGKSYWAVYRMIRDADSHDISFDIERRLRGASAVIPVEPELRERIRVGLDRIQKRGFVAEAKKWLQSMTPEGMKYGRREPGQTAAAEKWFRYENARALADKAGVSLEQLTNEMGLDLLELMDTSK